VTLEGAQQLLGVTGDPRAVDLIRAVAQGDLATGMQLIQQVREDGVLLPQFGREVAAHLRNLMLLKAEVPEALELPAELAGELRTLAGTMSLESITRALRIFGQLDFRGDGASSLPLELALVDAVTAPPAATAAVAQAASAAAAAPSTAPAASRAAVAPQRAEPGVAQKPAPAAPQRQPAPPTPIRSEVAPAPEPAPSQPAAPRAAGGQSLEEVRELIRGIKLPTVRFIESLLNSQHCTVEAVENNTITLGFNSNFKAHKDRLDQDANRRLIEQGLKELTGVDYRIRVVLVDNGGQPQQTETPKGHLVRAALDAGARRVSPDS
jgi:DNA polymerase III gamma/tau subunit